MARNRGPVWDYETVRVSEIGDTVTGSLQCDGWHVRVTLAVESEGLLVVRSLLLEPIHETPHNGITSEHLRSLSEFRLRVAIIQKISKSWWREHVFDASRFKA